MVNGWAGDTLLGHFARSLCCFMRFPGSFSQGLRHLHFAYAKSCQHTGQWAASEPAMVTRWSFGKTIGYFMRHVGLSENGNHWFTETFNGENKWIQMITAGMKGVSYFQVKPYSFDHVEPYGWQFPIQSSIWRYPSPWLCPWLFRPPTKYPLETCATSLVSTIMRNVDMLW